MITKILCEGCGRIYIPSATSSPVKCAFCNAVSRSPRSATSDLNGKVALLARAATKKPLKVAKQHPESWGTLTTAGAATCICAGCGEIFKSVGGFDAHREYREGELDRHCLTPDEMRKAGMSINERGVWIRKEFVVFDEQLQKAATA